MPAVTLKGKTGPPTTRKDGATIVVSKAVTAVLEERFPRTAMKGKQAKSVSAIELHAALKKERQTTQTLVSKQANEMFDGAAKKAEAALNKTKKDTAHAMSEAANKALDIQGKKTAAAMKAVIDKAAIQEKELAEVTAERDALQDRRARKREERGTRRGAAEAAMIPRTPGAAPKTPGAAPQTPGAAPKTPRAAPPTPQQRGRSRSMANTRSPFSPAPTRK
jgi:hypothetical protein